MSKLKDTGRILVYAVAALMLVLAGRKSVASVDLARPGVKERIVDSLRAVTPTGGVLPDSLVSRTSVGFQAGGAVVSAPEGLSAVYVSLSSISGAQAGPLPLTIDSIVVNGAVERDSLVVQQMVEIAPGLASWMAENEVSRLDRTFPDWAPGHTFTAYRRRSNLVRDLSQYYEVQFAGDRNTDSLAVTLGAVPGIDTAYTLGYAVELSNQPPDYAACTYSAQFIDSLPYLLPPSDTRTGIDAFRAWQSICDAMPAAPTAPIAISDGGGFGFDPLFHPDLRPAISAQSRIFVRSVSVHGTAVAAVAGAAYQRHLDSALICPTCSPTTGTDNGVLGVVPTGSLILVGTDRVVTNLARGLKYICDSTNARIVNMSWGARPTAPLDAVLDYAYFEKHLVLVAGAGNCDDPFVDCHELTSPGAHPGVIAVGAANKDPTVWEYSHKAYQLLTAPGVDIFTAGGRPKLLDTVWQTYGYGRWKGTSMSSPMVAGVAALILAAHPGLSPATVADILATSTWRPFDDTVKGWRITDGYGFLEAREALRVALMTCNIDIPGDVNKDCYVNYGDCAALAAYLGGTGTIASRKNADVDADCNLDISDLTLLLAYAMDGIGQLAVGCGPFRSAPIERKVADDQTVSTELYENYPNPFNLTTQISFRLPESQHVVLTVFNVTGQRVKQLINGEEPAGVRIIEWDGTNDRGGTIASGIYFYRLEAGDFSNTRKMLLLK
jgi:subtilisin family serine protease